MFAVFGATKAKKCAYFHVMFIYVLCAKTAMITIIITVLDWQILHLQSLAGCVKFVCVKFVDNPEQKIDFSSNKNNIFKVSKK